MGKLASTSAYRGIFLQSLHLPGTGLLWDKSNLESHKMKKREKQSAKLSCRWQAVFDHTKLSGNTIF